MRYGKQNSQNGNDEVNHKYYLFRFLDKMPRDKMPKPLDVYLKAVMMYYVATHHLQKKLKGDEMDYIRMLTEEYADAKG